MQKNDNGFKVLLVKEIYEFLEGSGEHDLVEYGGETYGLPYHTGAELADMCRKFGMTEIPCGSRWTYVEAMLQYAISNNRCDELFHYIFDLKHFNELKNLSSLEEMEKVHQMIVSAAIDEINRIIILTKKEMQCIGGHYYLVEVGSNPVIETPKFETISIAYARSLRERCEEDFINGNYDSVVTKSRTLIEETLIHILEENGVQKESNGDINKLYGQVKELLHMKQNRDYDKRVNGLLSGLEKIVQNIAEMRNTNSDAHGAGSSRINIQEREARLIMNSSVTFCEYLLSIRN